MQIRKTLGGALTAVLAMGSLAALATPSYAAPTYDIEQCMPSSGLGTVASNGTVTPLPKDNNVSVYAGGNFSRIEGAELEGQLVVDGDADLGSGAYSMGRVGVGSGMMPTAGSDVLRIGGDLSFPGPGTVEVSLIDEQDTLLESHVAVGGAVTGAGTIAVPGAGSSIDEGLGREAALGEPSFADWPSNDFAVLTSFIDQNVNHVDNVAGTATSEFGTLSLNGDASAARHTFTVDAADLNGFSLQVGENIDPTEPIIITVEDAAATLSIQGLFDSTMQAIDPTSARFGQLASQILWVFPNATDVELGGAQLPGSVVVPTAGSTTSMTAAGTNGRVWVAGDLIQNRAGSEFHNFPFIGNPDSTCNEPPTSPVVTTEVAPVTPDVTQAQCIDGEATEPTITLPTTEGITYTITGTVEAGNTVTITATSDENTTLTEADGWTLNNDGTATLEITLENPDCTEPTTEVAPVTPDVTQAQCIDGEATEPTITLPTTEGITYTITGTVEAGNTVTITATSDENTTLTEADGWTLNNDGTATLEITLENPDCTDEALPTETPDPTPTPVEPTDPDTPDAQVDEDGQAGGSSDSDELAKTGVTQAPMIALGLALLLAGGVLLAVRRKRA
ncbi:choice-of-anchor A family protein [Zhihengliuella flava]|uniref:Choice-of-anchor A domain-containing protein/LPXTG-motif cell wall-anchored protein n=1 Tax=Zhihengliuella flava TaxID=1285193 RepID=A0A931D9R8_9MICC|nr:choice-of-anchor A family protein [Zhihengliuella flava]MBG6084628.1 choice-of-anchor A domain-containing protein/LPXTG-motif cell wall-anchored protein [Zhihengliuella flava]